MGGRCLADNSPLGLVVFQFYGKVGTEKTKSQGGIFMHMADALVTPAVAGTMYACPAAVLVFIYEARTELLYGSDVTQAEAGKLSFKKILVVLALAAVVIGGGLSLMASEYPDGLEWSMEQVTGTAELEADGDAYETAAAVYQKFWRSGKHSGPYTCEAGLTGTQCACQICHHAG